MAQKDWVDSLWDEVNRNFQDVDEMIDRMFRTARTWAPSAEIIGPFTYGFSLTLGPDGRPIVQQFGNVRPTTEGLVELGTREPFVDVIVDDKNDQLKLTAEMPGVQKDDVKVEANETNVTLRAERGDRRYFKEISLRVAIEPKSAKATYNNGILEVILKLKEPVKPKGVEVKVE